jgi:rhodanese-related sulfurtransferase
MKAQELKDRLARGEETLIVDVREADEVASSPDPIPSATNVPMGRMFADAAKGVLPKDRKIVAVCKAGTRCGIVARELSAKGYDIESLEGGIDAWNEA